MEALGILVMRNSVVGNNNSRRLNPQEFRGFAIAHLHAPVIFINTADVTQAWTFTLMHEFVHLMLGESGVSDLSHKNDNQIEKFCNRVAADFLVPSAEMVQLWQSDVENWKGNLPELSAHYRKIIAEFQKTKDEQRQKDGGPPFARLINIRYSKNLAATVASKALSGRMLLRDAQHLIGVQPSRPR